MDEGLIENIVALAANYKQDFPLFCGSVLKVVSKDGHLVPFELNEQQVRLHNIIEEQRKRTGKVRVIVLKSRKLGISTYAAARFMHQTMYNSHQRAMVLTHVADSTNALFRIYKRFHEHIPEYFRPNINRNNAKELEFGSIDSSIRVGTAGSSQTGRGDTFHYFHASEIGFWSNGYEIAAGALQAVANVPGTEVIVESTPNGLGNIFADLWNNNATDPDSEWECIFLPWTVDSQCQLPVPDTFESTDEEREYARLWNLTNEQTYWRRRKIKELGLPKFTQEYPISAAECFRGTTDDSFISPESVVRARKNNHVTAHQNSPLILGVDVARQGKDKTAIVWRKGRVIQKYKKYSGKKGDELAHEIVEIIKKDHPSKICVDGTGGYGSAVVDCLRMMGYDAQEINFSSKPYKDKYFNRRAEMYGELRDWLERDDVRLPDEDEIEQDLCAFGFKHKGERLLLESKEDVKNRLKRSPDIGDAIALTFAVPMNEIATHSPYATSNWKSIMSKMTPDYAW